MIYNFMMHSGTSVNGTFLFFLHPRIPSSVEEESPINMLRLNAILTVISRCLFGVHGVEEFEVFTMRDHHVSERKQML